jgi:hypothetical protein
METKVTVEETKLNVNVTVSNERGPVAEGGGDWGDIGGTITDQTDLVSYIGTRLASGEATAKNVEFLARNQSGALIPKGSLVYISDATGNKPLITLAQANNDANSAQTIGFVKESIANNGTGYVITSGDLENVNTQALTAGQQLYLSPTTAGAWTTTKPSAPQHLVYVGIVVSAHPTQGIIYVSIQNGYELEELHNVSAETPLDGQVLRYNGFTQLWENANPSVTASQISNSTAIGRTLLTAALQSDARTAIAAAPSSGINPLAIAGTAVVTNQLSTTGGANKVPQLDASGNLTTGSFSNAGNTFGDPGNIHIPDLQGLVWLKKDGTRSGARIRHWQDHDTQGGELIIDSPWRLAFIPQGPIQVGANDSARYPRKVQLVSGYASNNHSSLNYMPSGAFSFQTSAWNGSGAVFNEIIAQAHALDTSGTNSVLRFWDQALVNGEQVQESIWTPGRGDVSGNLIAEIYKDGLWSRGTAPAFVTLADGATITQACSKYRTFQVGKVTLGGNRTLAISGAEAGMRGVIYVSQDATGSRTLALPSSSATPPAWSLSTAPGTIDRLSWEFDGQYYFWEITKGITLPLDSDAASYIAATGATDTAALNNFIVGLKAMGLWSTSVCWALRSTQNHGSGTAVRSFGGLGSFDGTMVGGPTWGANGIVFDGTDDRISILNPAKSTALAAYSMFSVFDSDQSVNRAVFGGFDSASTGVSPQIFAGGSPIQGSTASNMFFTTSIDGTNATATILSGGNTGSAQTAALSANSASVLSFANTSSVNGLPARASYWNDPANWFMGMRGNGSYYFLGSQAFHLFSTTRISEAQHTALRDLYKSTLGAGLSIP